MGSLIIRQIEIPASCANLPQGSSGSLSYNFTLSAYSDASSAGVPLYLAAGPASTSPEAGDWVIATSKTQGSDDWPYFNMVNGVMSPQAAAGAGALVPVTDPVDQGEVVTFLQAPNATPADIYCGANESDEYLVLSVNNNPNGFSLCTATNDDDLNVVVYEAAPGNTGYNGYNYDTCYAVNIYIVPVA
ncbi:hypothetical protein DAEQUDRAFT_767580 [Daedalea quercina L-15889]|uniref:Uncharacterized protein n=1 Tax=Daedalea quercina L-15889 TaxID=1314783 RepID=A0A165NFB9_9APHY|nr:hypothetical protein DAEQUDRAFT_767580 [Daedalea quercina L-15889]